MDLECNECSREFEWDWDDEHVTCEYCGAELRIEFDIEVLTVKESPLPAKARRALLPPWFRHGRQTMTLGPFSDATGMPMWKCHDLRNEWYDWIIYEYAPGERLEDSVARFCRGKAQDACRDWQAIRTFAHVGILPGVPT